MFKDINEICDWHLESIKKERDKMSDIERAGYISVIGKLSDIREPGVEFLSLTQKEKRDLLNVLRYCRHRIQVHPVAGIHAHGIDFEWLLETIKTLEGE